nr:hypothetical protein [uncultured Brevundimonas sp.]
MNTLQQIRDRRAQIAADKQALEVEDAELAAAERVVLRLESGQTHQLTGHAVASTAVTGTLTVVRRRNNKESVVQALAESSSPWLESGEINEAIAKLTGEPLKISSLYPLLTNLKKDGVLVRQGNKLALTARIRGVADVTS